MEGVESGQEELDQPLIIALGIQVEPRDSPSVLALTRVVGIPPRPTPSAMLAL